MIYLIGGSPRSGKSTLAKMLSKCLSCQLISIDDLRVVVIPYVAKKDIDKKFPFEKMFPNNSDLFFGRYTSKEILRADITEAKNLWPGVKSLIKHEILCGKEFIIEGVQLLPILVNQLKKEKIWKDIRIVYLVKIDEKQIISDIKKNEKISDWLLSTTKNKETLIRAAEMISEYGRYLSREAKKYKFGLFVTDKNFKAKLNQAADYNLT